MAETVAWHPWSGCSPISPSCTNCYAVPREKGELVDLTERGFVFNGKLRFNEKELLLSVLTVISSTRVRLTSG